MSGRDRGREMLAKLSQKVREKIAPDGEAVLNLRGQKAVVDLAADLTNNNALPGLKHFRDAVDRVRFQRAMRNAELTVMWDRSISALVVIVEQGPMRQEIKFTWRADEDAWHRLDGPGELYEEITTWVAKLFYPEVK